jgi:hypothetical protein
MKKGIQVKALIRGGDEKKLLMEVEFPEGARDNFLQGAFQYEGLKQIIRIDPTRFNSVFLNSFLFF